jgi:dihydroceramidase
MSYYCAEVCNVSLLLHAAFLRVATANVSLPAAQTVTNIVFIWLGLKGIRGCLKYSHPPIFVVAFLGYMVVGVGSTLFHATLKCTCHPPRQDCGAIRLNPRQILCSSWMSWP